jgi:hypothetical protein
MLAACHGHGGAVRALLQRGADPGRPNDRGQTPLAGAVFKHEPDIVRALLNAGADPHAGRPIAADTARMFGNEDFMAWFADIGTGGFGHPANQAGACQAGRLAGAPTRTRTRTHPRPHPHPGPQPICR